MYFKQSLWEEGVGITWFPRNITPVLLKLSAWEISRHFFVPSMGVAVLASPETPRVREFRQEVSSWESRAVSVPVARSRMTHIYLFVARYTGFGGGFLSSNSPQLCITTGASGRSFSSVLKSPMISTTSWKPRITRPKTTCFPTQWVKNESKAEKVQKYSYLIQVFMVIRHFKTIL